MSMLNVHGTMPAAASATGSGTAVGISAQTSGFGATALLVLGIALLVLTAVFALAAVRGMLPARNELPTPGGPLGRGERPGGDEAS